MKFSYCPVDSVLAIWNEDGDESLIDNFQFISNNIDLYFVKHRKTLPFGKITLIFYFPVKDHIIGGIGMLFERDIAAIATLDKSKNELVLKIIEDHANEYKIKKVLDRHQPSVLKG